jgi:glycine cleavage system H protein
LNLQSEGRETMTKATATLLYSKEHEWVLQLDGNRVRIGISDFAQKQLGDIVFVETLEVDDEVRANESMGTIESVKAVSDLYSPVSGTVVTVNEELGDAPETINEHPFEAGWLVEVEMSNPEELESLLNEDAYQAFINEGEE